MDTKDVKHFMDRFIVIYGLGGSVFFCFAFWWLPLLGLLSSYRLTDQVEIWIIVFWSVSLTSLAVFDKIWTKWKLKNGLLIKIKRRCKDCAGYNDGFVVSIKSLRKDEEVPVPGKEYAGCSWPA